MKSIKRILKILLLIVVLIALYFGYRYYDQNIRATRIAFVNLPDYTYASYKEADESAFISLVNIPKTDNFEQLSDYDVVYLWGMGFRPTEEQLGHLQALVENGIPLYVFIATSAEADISSLSPTELKEVEAYFKSPGPENNRNLLHYSRKVLDLKKWFAPDAEPARFANKNYFFHPETDEVFESLSAYETFLKEKSLYHDGAPKVLILCSNLLPSNPFTRDPYYQLINELSKYKLNIFPATGFTKRLDFVKEVKPELIVYLPHGRLAPGKNDEVIQSLKELNSPVLGAQIVFEDYQKWQESQMGLSGAMLTQNIIAPEFDGVVAPYVIGAQFPNDDGLKVFKGIPGRVQKFASLVNNYVDLRHLDNKDKKVAIYYYKGPGQNAMASEGLEITPSLLNLLRHLKSEGYTTGPLPQSSKELHERIQKEGKLFGPYAVGSMGDFVETANPPLLHPDTLKHWMGKAMDDQSRKEVADLYGEAPGDYMIHIRDSVQKLIVARVQFGNIVLLPQPLPAIGENEFKLIHGAKKAPPYPYLGSYLWTRYGFKADAIMHFGTHGSLEFTPYKQTGLSSHDWSDILLGDMPHFYYYVVGNVGEGMIAKRRGYATLISHLNPPFDQSGMGKDLQDIKESMESLQRVTSNEALRFEYEEKLKKQIVASQLDQQLNLNLDESKKLDSHTLEKISEYIYSVDQEKITLGLHTLGKEWDEQKIHSTLRMMTVDRIAYNKALLDIQKGLLTEEQKEDPELFDQRYYQPALALVDRILQNKDMKLNEIIPEKDMQRAQRWQMANRNMDFSVMMGNMMAAFEKEPEEEEAEVHKADPERVKQLTEAMIFDKGKKDALEKMRDPVQFQKTSKLLDRSSRNKVKQVAKMVPKLQAMLDIMLQDDMLELLGLMQNAENYESVYSLLDDPGLMASIEQRDQNQNEALALRFIEAENLSVIAAATQNKLPLKGFALEELEGIKELLTSFADAGEMLKSVDNKHPDLEVLMKLSESKSAMEQVQNILHQTDRHIRRLQEEEKAFAKAVLDYAEAISAIHDNYKKLQSSPQAELQSLSTALSGGYILPGSGGDVVRNMASIPTGRNFYSIDAEQTPTKEAWALGKRMAEQIIEEHVSKNGTYPQKVAFTLWGGEFIRGEGSTIAQALYMLGVEPVRSMSGVVKDVKLIPSDKLGRPRIDVVVQTSGQFRDFASSRIFLINKAIKLVSSIEEEEAHDNFVSTGTKNIEKALIKEGYAPEEARSLSTARVFGGVNGNYGTAIMGLVEQGDEWESEEEIADQYIQNMGAIYTEEHWGEYKAGMFKSALENTEMVIQPRSSNAWGPLSLDHVYEFMGGLTSAVRNTTGKDPDAYFVDTRSQQNSFVQKVDEAIWVEAQSTLFNPKYIGELTKGEASSAEVFAETTRDMYGWNVMKPDAIDEAMWDKMHKVYVQDEMNLGLRNFFEEQNPFALQEVSAVMLETVRKGYWNPDPEVVKEIAELHADLVKDHKAGCSEFVCDNAKLENFISEQLSDQQKQTYQQEIQKVQNLSGEQAKQSTVLKKVEDETKLSNLLKDNKNLLFILGGLFLVIALTVIIGRVRK